MEVRTAIPLSCGEDVIRRGNGSDGADNPAPNNSHLYIDLHFLELRKQCI